MSDLDVFFNPKTVAIVGASERLKFGHGTTNYLLNSKFKTFPVNPTKEVIMGHKAYKSVKNIPEEIDLAILIVNNDNVLQAVKECVEKEVKGIIIETAGFAETGIDKYVKVQKELEYIAKNRRVRIIGPNCVGVTNFLNEFTTTEVDFSRVGKGSISIVAQSGVLGNIFIDWSGSQKIGISKAVTLGNKVDVDEIDVLEFLENDPETKVITLYLEGVKRGKEFLDVVKKMRKPILILKNGRSEYGSNAMKSHTASIAGNDQIFESIFKRHQGMFRVNNFYAMFNIAHIFATQPLPKGKNVAIITGSGSLGIIACDEIERHRLNLAKFSEQSLNSMREVAPNWVSLKNPVDLGPSQFQTLRTCLKAVLNDENVDSLLFIFSVPQSPLQSMNVSMTPVLKFIRKKSQILEKPVIICVFGSRWVYDYMNEQAAKFDIPVISRIKYAIKAFKMMFEYRKYLETTEM